jgi:tRNA nucleotidyltransferase (CCA-adding enzyme)
MNQQVLKICEAVRQAGGRAMLVGGCVRDRLFGFEPKDFDLEVYHLEPSRLRAILQSLAQVNTVGEHFAVYKLAFYSTSDDKLTARNPQPATRKRQTDNQSATTEPRSVRFEIDVSIPRRESKSGKGHRGFVIQGDPHMTFEEAARRRDFTINAIMQDPLTSEIIDPFGGVADLQNRTLRVVAPDTFVEDSLRVLRAVQIAARFEMNIEAQTLALCRSIDLADLPHERIWGEVEKLLLLANRPSIGLQAALDLGVLDKLFPQVGSRIDCQSEDNRIVDNRLPAPANKQNAFARTKERLDEVAKLAGDLPKEKRLAVMLAALCLNLFTPSSPDLNAKIVAENEAIRSVLDILGLHTIAGYNVRGQALSLVREQAKLRQLYAEGERTTDGDFRRLAQRVDMPLLYLLAKADMLTQGSSTEAAEWFAEKTAALNLEDGAPAPILFGRHLLEAGMQPGPQIGVILRRVYELQLDGTVTTLAEALAAAKAEA